MSTRLVGALVVALLAGCGNSRAIDEVVVPAFDVQDADAGVADAGVADAGVSDAGSPGAFVSDAGVPDAGVPDAGSVALLAINCGGFADPPFAADQSFSGGLTATNWMGPIDTLGVMNAAPMGVYQTERYGNMSYALGGLTPGRAYSVRLHFAENYMSQPGERIFHVAINGTRVLEAFDVFAAAGAAHRAHVRTFSAIADGSGEITIAFSSVINNGLINGIELF